MDIRKRVKRRLATYKGRHITCTWETDFMAIFNVIGQKLGVKHNDFDAVVEKASEEDLQKINHKLDEYQICKRIGF